MAEVKEDYYEFLGVARTATAEEIKKAYYKRAMKYHPDKIQISNESERQEATLKFQQLSHVYSILSDSRLRQIYDQTGSVEADEIQDHSDRDWVSYWRDLFPPVTKKALEQAEQEYVGSDEELQDLKRVYTEGKGKMQYLLENINFASTEQEERYRQLLQPFIDSGELKSFKAWTNEKPAAKNARLAKAKKEATEAEQHAKELGLQNDDDLTKIIQRRSQARSEGFLASLESKYAPKKAKRQKKDDDVDAEDGDGGSGSHRTRRQKK